MPLAPLPTPAYLPYQQAPPPGPFGAFTGQAPTPTTTAAFQAPNPANAANSPAYQFRLSQGLKGIERGAAARGTLLTGGLQTRLNDYAADSASQEYDKDYARTLAAYNTNRDTDSANYGRAMTGFQGDLSVYDTNRTTSAMNLAQPRQTLMGAPPPQTPGADPQADYNAMLTRRQEFEAQNRQNDERRRAATLADDQATLAQRQLTGNQTRIADEARKAEAARTPAPAASGYQDMLAQYAQFQQQQEEDYRRQLAGSQAQNAASTPTAMYARAAEENRARKAAQDALAALPAVGARRMQPGVGR